MMVILCVRERSHRRSASSNTTSRTRNLSRSASGHLRAHFSKQSSSSALPLDSLPLSSSGRRKSARSRSTSGGLGSAARRRDRVAAERHAAGASADTTLPCGACGRSFDSDDLLLSHWQAHPEHANHATLHACRGCAKGFASAAALALHEEAACPVSKSPRALQGGAVDRPRLQLALLSATVGPSEAVPTAGMVAVLRAQETRLRSTPWRISAARSSPDRGVFMPPSGDPLAQACLVVDDAAGGVVRVAVCAVGQGEPATVLGRGELPLSWLPPAGILDTKVNLVPEGEATAAGTKISVRVLARRVPRGAPVVPLVEPAAPPAGGPPRRAGGARPASMHPAARDTGGAGGPGSRSPPHASPAKQRPASVHPSAANARRSPPRSPAVSPAKQLRPASVMHPVRPAVKARPASLAVPGPHPAARGRPLSAAPTTTAAPGAGSFSCPECNSTYDTQTLLDRHLEIRHSERAVGKVGVFACAQCDKRYESLVLLDRHIDLRHGEANGAGGANAGDHGPRFPCSQCTKVYPTRQLLQRHEEMRHVPGRLTVIEQDEEPKPVYDKVGAGNRPRIQYSALP